MADPNSVNPKKVRVVGKIKGQTEQESKSLTQPWITFKNPQANGPSEKSLVFFDVQSTSRRDVYELDYCYGQDEEIDVIYSREIKPLILETFDGRNASIIALGARRSGKTYIIQGSKERPGLAVMAMSEILSRARELGKLVSVSLYGLTQDHAYDLLDPKHPEVQVLEDAHGKINLKGLSQVQVKSIEEFNNIYFSQCGIHKTQKPPIDQPRNHKGLMVHISSDEDKLKPKLANKIHFVDLAGYEDPKKSRRDGTTLVESHRTNKSLYALLNVISALTANETHLPYRASKFTRILQDSLHGTSRILLLTCLNAFFCEDTISSINLVSRSYRSTKQVLTDSTNRSQSSAKAKVLSSLKSGKTVSASLSVKKLVGSRHLLSEQKASSTVKGRKLFDEGKRINQEQLKCQSEDTSAHKSEILSDLALEVPPFSPDEAPPDKNVSETSPTAESRNNINPVARDFPSIPILQDTLLLAASHEKPAILAEKDISPHIINHLEATPHINLDIKPQNHSDDASTYEVKNMSHKKNEGSPPLSERIREISNNLKALCSSTPLRIKMQEAVALPSSSQVGHSDTLEPKTPVTELSSAKHCSPCGSFSNRISGVKHSVVQEYLKFLNSASKEELKGLKGIAEKRATYILELREETPEPFKTLDDLQGIGMSAKQIKGMMRQVAGQLFDDN